MKTKHAILFRLSNKVVQVNYNDNTELVMASTSKKVSYFNKKGERLNFMLQHALESDNQEMIKRLNYARQVLEHTLRENPGVQNRAATATPGGYMTAGAAQTARPQSKEAIGMRRQAEPQHGRLSGGLSRPMASAR